jgi:hypothetical protein
MTSLAEPYKPDATCSRTRASSSIGKETLRVMMGSCYGKDCHIMTVDDRL